MKLARIGTRTTFGVNIPICAWNSVEAFQRKEYQTVACHAVALCVLFLPEGRLIAMGLDTVSEFLNAYTKSLQRQKSSISDSRPGRLDPTVRENAVIMLGLSAEEALNRETVYQRYEALVKNLTTKRDKLPLRPYQCNTKHDK
ncbi:MAG: hypothetical protein LVR00_09855 [Rhabdochlamydiaceae bacterium]